MSAGQGGGTSQCALTNCAVAGNSASSLGGGATFSTLNNCTVVSNTFGLGGHGGSGGGAYSCSLNNCIIYYNTASSGPDISGGTVNYCCTPGPPGGPGNFSLPPRFVDQAHLNLRLQSNSPCINAGNNTYASGATDLDANPRMSGGTVDVGAYEFQSPASTLSYAWLQQYGLATDGSADHADPDRDSMDNWQEWICGTNPTNAASVLRMLPPICSSAQVTVTWQSVTNRSYLLERASDPAGQPGFVPLATNIPGTAGTTTFTDTNVAGAGQFFYRVGVSH